MPSALSLKLPHWLLPGLTTSRWERIGAIFTTGNKKNFVDSLRSVQERKPEEQKGHLKSLLPASGVRPSNRQRKGEQTLLPAQKDFKQCITWLVTSAYAWNEGKFSVSKEWTPVLAAGRVVMLGTSTHAKELEKGRREKAWPVLPGCTSPLEHPRGTS